MQVSDSLSLQIDYQDKTKLINLEKHIIFKIFSFLNAIELVMITNCNHNFKRLKSLYQKNQRKFICKEIINSVPKRIQVFGSILDIRPSSNYIGFSNETRRFFYTIKHGSCSTIPCKGRKIPSESLQEELSAYAYKRNNGDCIVIIIDNTIRKEIQRIKYNYCNKDLEMIAFFGNKKSCKFIEFFTKSGLFCKHERVTSDEGIQEKSKEVEPFAKKPKKTFLVLPPYHKDLNPQLKKVFKVQEDYYCIWEYPRIGQSIFCWKGRQERSLSIIAGGCFENETMNYRAEYAADKKFFYIFSKDHFILFHEGKCLKEFTFNSIMPCSEHFHGPKLYPSRFGLIIEDIQLCYKDAQARVSDLPKWKVNIYKFNHVDYSFTQIVEFKINTLTEKITYVFKDMMIFNDKEDMWSVFHFRPNKILGSLNFPGQVVHEIAVGDDGISPKNIVVYSSERGSSPPTTHFNIYSLDFKNEHDNEKVSDKSVVI